MEKKKQTSINMFSIRHTYLAHGGNTKRRPVPRNSYPRLYALHCTREWGSVVIPMLAQPAVWAIFGICPGVRARNPHVKPDLVLHHVSG